MKLCYVRSFLTTTDERAIIKLGLKTGAGSSHGKSVQAPIQFVILHFVYDSLGRPRVNESASQYKDYNSKTMKTQ